MVSEGGSGNPKVVVTSVYIYIKLFTNFWLQTLIKQLAEVEYIQQKKHGLHMVFILSRRHMLLFNAYSPVGHAIHVCSMVAFVIGDEDVVLPNFEPVNILANLLPSLWFQKFKLNLILIF